MKFQIARFDQPVSFAHGLFRYPPAPLGARHQRPGDGRRLLGGIGIGIGGDCARVARPGNVGGTDYTAGLVADLIGTQVVGVQQDDSPGYDRMIAESKIYPPALRSTALNDINYDGPAWLRELAAKVAGCPRGVHW